MTKLSATNPMVPIIMRSVPRVTVRSPARASSTDDPTGPSTAVGVPGPKNLPSSANPNSLAAGASRRA